MNDSSVKYLEKALAGDAPGAGEYKMIAVDMDGTLLDNQKQISKETVRAVRKLMQTEIVFVISTGRPLQGVEKYKDLLRPSRACDRIQRSPDRGRGRLGAAL